MSRLKPHGQRFQGEGVVAVTASIYCLFWSEGSPETQDKIRLQEGEFRQMHEMHRKINKNSK